MTETATTEVDGGENLTAAAGCLAGTGIRNAHGEDCGGLLRCVLDVDHEEGAHYDASEEIWWLPGGVAERHDPSFECRPIHSGEDDTDDPGWVPPAVY